MASRDYILCDGCSSKLIYDGYDVARDTFDDAKPPLLLCGDCASKFRGALEAAHTFVAEELENRERSFLTPSGDVPVPPDDDEGFTAYILPARDVLAKLRAALGR